MGAARENVLHKHDCQSFCSLTYAHFWLLHTHTHTHSHCADLPVKFHWGSLLTSPLLSPSSLTPLFISFLSSSSTEGREDLSLTTSHCQVMEDSVTRIILQLWPRTLARGDLDPGFFGGRKYGNKGRVLPQTWSWRTADDAAWGCFGGVEGCEPQWLLQFAPSLSLILSLSLSGGFPSLQQALLRSRTPSLFSSFFSSLFVRESLFVQTRWGLAKREERHLHCLTELRHFLKAPKSHGKG